MNATRSTLRVDAKVPALFLALSLLLPVLDAKQPQAGCGTWPDRAKEELWRSRQSAHQRQTETLLRRLQGFAVAEPPRGAAKDVGEIALLEEDATLITRRNLFNLPRRLLRFTPVLSGYRLEVNESDYSDAEQRQGQPVEALGDDDSRELALPFSFPFFGVRYSRVNLNSDGNLTFEAGDGSSRERGLGRFLSGLPRIGPFFADLDPSRAGAVFVLSRADRFTVTWLAVPEYADFGIGPQNTFQLRLFPDGRIEIAYDSIQSVEAVVGIAPGRLTGSSSVVGLAASSGQSFPAAIAERFIATEEVDTVTVAQRFYETHEDAYDYLVIYNALGVAAGSGVVAFEVTARNPRTGYGDPVVDFGTDYGSPRRLQAVLNLGPTNQYPLNPDTILPQRSSARDTPITVIAHEAGHLFLAFASVRDPQNPSSQPMLGRQSAHWAFTFNSEASLLEGNRILDRGPGASPRFQTVAVTEQYSPFDQYLMGFRPKEEVPLLFYVSDSGFSTLFSPPPSVGSTFNGTRRDVSVDDIVRVVGRRTPDSTVSQRNFRFAFILLTPAGFDVPQSTLNQLEEYRRRFESFYFQAAGQRATAVATLRKEVAFSLWPAAGLVAGQSATASLRLARPVPAPESFTLRSRSGLLEVPTTVGVPAGQREVSFPIRASRAGLDTLEVTPVNSAYEIVEAKLAVQTGAAAVQLRLVSGEGQLANGPAALPQPIVVKATDDNGLPYPGLRILATPLGTGQVNPPASITAADGTASFSWTPAAPPFNQLRFRLDGAPDANSITATALGRPYLLATSVVNAASFRPGLTPFALHSLFGANLAGGATAAPPSPWPTRSNEVEVLVNNVPQPIAYLSDGQINFYLADAITGEATLEVRTPYGTSGPVKMAVQALSPAVFFDPLTGQAAALSRGTSLEVYGTGFGPVTTRDGFLQTVTPVQASINGLPATVAFAGIAPGFVGLYQVNVQLPANARPPFRIQLTQAGLSSNETLFPQ